MPLATGHGPFHPFVQEDEPASAEQHPAPSRQALVAYEGEPAEEPVAAAGANLKWPEMRPNEVVAEEMKKFAASNGAQIPAGAHQQPLPKNWPWACLGYLHRLVGLHQLPAAR